MSNKKEYMKKYRAEHKDRIEEYNKKYRAEHRKELREKEKKYRIKNLDKIKAYESIRSQTRILNGYQRRYYAKHKPERIKQRCQYNLNKEYRENNHKSMEELGETNRERRRKRDKEWRKKKRKIDLKYNLSRRMSSAIYYSLRRNKKGKHWEDLVGWTVKDLEKRLRKTMPKGYNWKDFKNGKLHIDHIIPISAFNYTKPEHIDFKRCWALENLNLLPARENRIKHNKLDRPFQPSFRIANISN